MKEIELQNLKPVSFDTIKNKLTDGELALLALMKKKIEASESINREEIVTIWDNHVRKFQGIEFYSQRRKEYVLHKYGDWEIKQRAMQWFRSSLGNLILKAKLVVIPVIDIN